MGRDRMEQKNGSHSTWAGKGAGYLRSILCVAVVLSVCGGIFYYGVMNGWFLLNRPGAGTYSVRGVDVSHYQGDIDWSVLSAQDISFAYIKATEGSRHRDPRFEENWEESAGTGLYTGAYHFFSFDSPAESQAQNFIQTVGKREGMLPPVVDFEFYGDKRSNPPPVSQAAEQLELMLEMLGEHYGVTPVIYAREETYEMYLEGGFEAYPLWIRNVVRRPKTDREWTFWQYANRGRLKGYSGQEKFIDLNVFAGSKEQWEQFVQTGKPVTKAGS